MLVQWSYTCLSRNPSLGYTTALFATESVQSKIIRRKRKRHALRHNLRNEILTSMLTKKTVMSMCKWAGKGGERTGERGGGRGHNPARNFKFRFPRFTIELQLSLPLSAKTLATAQKRQHWERKNRKQNYASQL